MYAALSKNMSMPWNEHKHLKHLKIGIVKSTWIWNDSSFWRVSSSTFDNKVRM